MLQEHLSGLPARGYLESHVAPVPWEAGAQRVAHIAPAAPVPRSVWRLGLVVLLCYLATVAVFPGLVIRVLARRAEAAAEAEAGGAGSWWEPGGEDVATNSWGEVRAHPGPAALSLCATARPLSTRFANIFGASVSEATMRPNP
jgi:hypothetical protein